MECSFVHRLSIVIRQLHSDTIGTSLSYWEDHYSYERSLCHRLIGEKEDNMSETGTANPLIEEIRNLWLQTEESQRVDPVEAEFEMSLMFQTTMRHARLRLAELKSHINDPARFDAEVQKIEKELELCRLIGELSSSNETRRL